MNHAPIAASSHSQTVSKRTRFFNRIAAITLNRPQSSISIDDAVRFWNAVVFYNYVPVMVDGRSAEKGGNVRRPTKEMFAAGAVSLQQVLREREPQAVIVCGLDLWDWVAPSLDGFEGRARDVIYYDDGRSVFARIRHPSSPHFREREWPARVNGLIELSVGARTSGKKVIWQPDDDVNSQRTFEADGEAEVA